MYKLESILILYNYYEIVHSGWQLHNDLDADSKWKYTKGLSLDSILGYSNKVEYIYAINKAYTYVILWLSASSMCLWFLI